MAVTSGGSPQTDCHNKCTDTALSKGFGVMWKGRGAHGFSLMGVGCFLVSFNGCFLVSFKWVVGVDVIVVKFLSAGQLCDLQSRLIYVSSRTASYG